MEGRVWTAFELDVVSLTLSCAGDRRGGEKLTGSSGDEPISDETLKDITKVVQEAGIKLADEPEGNKEGALEGWEGGVIWLVPTDKPISEWGKPIAVKRL